jgi:hypothetical protein
MMVLYCIAAQLAPPLDLLLSESTYAYRLNPKRTIREQPLFKDRKEPEDARSPGEDQKSEDISSDEEPAEGGEFPYDWFKNWIRFERGTRVASEEYEHVAITDITAFFENISLSLLIGRLHELLGQEHREVLKRLHSLLSYWDWVISEEKTSAKGLPQGNDVSSFLSNIYLLDLDNAMLRLVENNTEKYFRYVDDVRLYTGSKSEARRALVEIEHTLRKLGLNVQSSKTEVKPASESVDRDVVEWMDRLALEAEDKVEQARRFISQELSARESQPATKWQRIYRRSLTVLSQASDDTAVEAALDMFLSDPSDRQLRKNFRYLRKFAPYHCYEEQILGRLQESEFTFDYHRAFLFRLAAYSRGDCPVLQDLAFEESLSASAHWYTQVAALLFLSTCRLTRHQLAQITQSVENEGNAQVARAKYVVMCQSSGDELRGVLDKISYFSAPHQDYLRRYFFRLAANRKDGESELSTVSRMKIGSPFFIRVLHPLDLVKANRHLRRRFREVLQQKLGEFDKPWPRLHSRLDGINTDFIDSP